MPAPRIFVSSTCYDLKYIRENLKHFISSLGYEPILSEEGSVFYDPTKHAQDACLAEVPSCQMLVLIIGGRYGSQYKETDKSITNKEFEKASEAKVPIFSLVERPVYDQYRFWLVNKENAEIDENAIIYPAVDSTKIFEFIQQVQSASVNNAIILFDDFEGMQSYLKQQWASMTYQFLTTESQAKKVDETLSAISDMSRKIEFITRQIAKSIETDKADMANVKIKIMDMIESRRHPLLNTLKKIMDLDFIPENILKEESLEMLLRKNHVKIEIKSYEGHKRVRLIHPSGAKSIAIPLSRFDKLKENYKEIRESILSILKEYHVSEKDFLSEK